MTEVDELTFEDFTPKTRIWMSDKAAEDFERYPQNASFHAKLERYAKNGFEFYEGGEGKPLKHEWDGVWRIAHDLYRLIGFYENGANRSAFIVLDAFLKRGQTLSYEQRERINKVAEIRADKSWEKRQQP